MKKLTTDEVKRRIIEIHGNKYDLSKVRYKNRRTKVEIVCMKHGIWLTNTEQLFRGQGCPSCGGKVTTEENSLLSNFPKLIEEWDFDKNEISPSEISFGSNKNVWWKCSENHSFSMNPKTRTRKGMEQNCPYCSNRRIDNSNSLISLKPEWVSDWNHKKNKDISPDSIGINSNKKIWWKCSEGHEWYVSPNQRLTYNTNCPNCATSGYKTELDGFLYLHLVIVDSKKGLKYGITNFPDHRLKNLKTLNKRDSNSNIKPTFTNLFTMTGEGLKILEMEGQIREQFGKSYFTKNELPHGYTETIPYTDDTPINILNELLSEGLTIVKSKLHS